ncbi:hypothetical protein [uncultured Dokdonia sp.]|uniref:hypothetical protein n=1 Tax=uncultured Dokdonia sp. TaxID=575653 RepID=UPI0026287910|nr:hypothetical protein [uncultured Dokdonia sp.]
MHKPLSIYDFSKRRAIISILLALGATLIFYFFQQYFFSLYRSAMLSFQFNVNYLLSDDAISLFAFVFAGNAVIVGNSVGISFYISCVSKSIRQRSRRRNILNNQSFLLGNYIYLFIKLAFLIGFMQFMLLKYGFLEESWAVYILLFSVLFLESVKELRRSFKEYTVKILLLHFVVVFAFIFSCSLLKKSNYNRLNEVYDKSHPYVNVPTTTYDMQPYDNPIVSPYNRYLKIFVKVLDDSSNLNYKIYDELTVEEVVEAPYSEEYNHYGRKYSVNPILTIHADRILSYAKLKELESKAIIRGINKLNYVVHSTINDQPYVYTKYIYPTKALYANTEKSKPPSPLGIFFFEDHLKDKKEQIVNLETFILNEKVDEQKVYTYFQESVSDSVFFKLKVSQKITLQHYLDFMISYKQSVYDLRDEQKRMNHALNEYALKAENKYPFLFVEEME